MSYNPQFGGYNQSFFNPYGYGGMPQTNQMQWGGGYPGMGYGGMPQTNQMQWGGGYPGMDTMGMGGYNPGGFMNNFQSQLQDMFDKYFSGQQTDATAQMEPGMTEVPGVTPTTGAPSGNASTVASSGATPAPAPTTPDFGNLGARFDQGKTLTRKAEKKLNRMGYTDDDLINARQAGGGAQGFRDALGGMQPTYKAKTNQGNYTRTR